MLMKTQLGISWILLVTTLCASSSVVMSQEATDNNSNSSAPTSPTVPSPSTGIVWCSRPPTLQLTPFNIQSKKGVDPETLTTSVLASNPVNFSLAIVDTNINLFVRHVQANIAVQNGKLLFVYFHNLTHLYVVIGAQDTIDLFQETPITVQVREKGLMCDERQNTADTTGIGASATFTFKADPQLISPEAKESTQAVATTAGAVSGLASSSTLATQTARASMVLSLTECKFKHNAKLDSSASPTGYRFGSAQGGYYRGGIVGNMIIMVCFGGLMVIAGLLCFAFWTPFRSQGATGLRLALERVHFPGLLILPFATLLPGTSMCAMALSLHGVDDLDILLSVLTFCYLVGVLGFFGFRLTRGFGAKFVPDEMEYAGKVKAGNDLPGAHKVFHGSHRWTDGGKNFKNAYGSLFADYREGFQAFMCIELGITLIAGILDGIRPEDGGCLGIGIGVLVCNFAFCIPAIGVRPCSTLYNTVHLIVNSVLIFISAVFLVISQVGGGNEDIAFAAGIVSTITIYLAFVKAGGDVLIGFQKIYWACGDYRKKKKNKGENGDSTTKKKKGATDDDFSDTEEDKIPLVVKGHDGGSTAPIKKATNDFDDDDTDGRGTNVGRDGKSFNKWNIEGGDTDFWENQEADKDVVDDPFADISPAGSLQIDRKKLQAFGKDAESQRLHDQIKDGLDTGGPKPARSSRAPGTASMQNRMAALDEDADLL